MTDDISLHGLDNYLLRRAYGKFSTAIHIAVYDEQIDISRLLIKSNADVNTPLDRGPHGSMLAIAVASRHTEMTQLLLEAGAEVDMILKHGYHGNALCAAIASNGKIGPYYELPVSVTVMEIIQMVKTLLDAGAKVRSSVEYIDNRDNPFVVLDTLKRQLGDEVSECETFLEEINQLLQQAAAKQYLGGHDTKPQGIYSTVCSPEDSQNRHTFKQKPIRQRYHSF